jgi:head-tail adaptor
MPFIVMEYVSGKSLHEACHGFATDPAVWASVKAKATREATTEDRTAATGTFVFTIYNRSDVSEIDRILWNSVAYNIRGIMREGSRELFLVLECERGVST